MKKQKAAKGQGKQTQKMEWKPTEELEKESMKPQFQDMDSDNTGIATASTTEQ